MPEAGYRIGELLEAVRTVGRLVEGSRYRVFQSDTLNGLARIESDDGEELKGAFTFQYLASTTKRLDHEEV